MAANRFPSSADAVVGELATFAAEQAADDRLLPRTVAVAVTAHLALLALHLPTSPHGDPPSAPSRPVFVVQAPIFEPPAPPAEATERKVRKVPIPAPAPEEPEPIRDVAMEEAAPSVPVDPAVWIAIPEAPPAGAVEEDLLIVGGDVLPPERLVAPDPVYPEAARRAGVGGIAIVEAIVERDGTVRDVALLKDPGLGLGPAAAAAVKVWRFRPATRRGEPVPVRYVLTVKFGVR